MKMQMLENQGQRGLSKVVHGKAQSPVPDPE